MLATDLVLAGFYANGSDLLVDYDVAGDTARPFDIEIYASADGVTADTLLAAHHVGALADRDAGSHTATIAADFADPANDYYLIAKLDANFEALDLAQLNNDLLFQGGAFKAADGTVHVHGTPGKDTLTLYQSDTYVDVQLNGNLWVYDGVWSRVHIRPHGADDAVAVHSTPSTTTPVWTFDEHGANLLAGTPDDGQIEVRPGSDDAEGVKDPFGPLDSGGIGGALDESFSGDGIATTNISGYMDRGQGIAIQPDGKIVLVGYTLGGQYYDFALVRYNSDGTPDSTFNGDGNSDGIITTEFGSLNAYACGVALQSDGKIVVVGYAAFGANYGDFVVARYNPNGSLDSTFNGDGNSDGIITTDFAGNADRASDVAMVMIGSEERIVVAGCAFDGANLYDFALARYTPNGTLDSTFNGDGNNDGKITTDFTASSDRASSMVIQPDGKIVLAGEVMWNSYPYDTDFGLARYNSDGSPDASFNGDGNNDGEITTQVGNAGNAAGGLALQADGKIVAVGYAYIGSDCNFAVVRYNPDGSPDASFNGDGNNDGEITTPFFAGADCATDVAVADEGKIVVVGYAHNGSNYDIALARYLSDGTLDPDFRDDATPDGKVTTDVAGREDRGNCVALDAAKRIVVGGSAYVTFHDFMVARYMPDDPDIEITGFSVNPEDDTKLDVSYYIYNADPDAFDIAIYASFDAQNPETLLIDHFAVSNPADRTPGAPHTVSIAAVFRNQAQPGQDPVYDLELDYFLMAKVDSQDEVVEANELNNTRLFDGGIFLDDPHDIVHVHGTDVPNQQYPAVDKKDVLQIRLHVVENSASFRLWLNADPDGEPSEEYAETDVSQFDVRTHDGNDEVLTPALGDAKQFSAIEAAMWVFAGEGDDLVYGGDAQDLNDPPEQWQMDVLPVVRDRLYGGPGNDAISGGLGPDAIYGEDGNDALEGGASRDWIHGGLADDRIEGWSERDFLWGDEGNDIITGGLDDSVGLDDRDIIWGGAGDDRIDGWKGNDEIYGNAGNDEIYGGKGDDYISGGAGHDNLFGEEDYDNVYGDDGDDLIYGGPGLDYIIDSPETSFVLDDEYWFPAPPPVWPDDLPWPELNLVADVTADVIVDDRGPGWDSSWSYKLPEEPRPPDPGYWFIDDDQSPAFGGAQSYLYAHDVKPDDPEEDPNGDAFGDGKCESVWYLPVWTEQADVYVTWDPRADATTAASFLVRSMGRELLPPSPITLDQTKPPDEQGLPWLPIGDHKYTKLGTFDVLDGWLVVSLSDLGVPVGKCIVADAVLVDPVQLEPGSEAGPGSWANREENGFYGGLLLQMQSAESNWRRIDVRIEGLIDPQTQQSRLAGRSVRLDWEGDGTVIEVYIYDDDIQEYVRIDPETSWLIGDPDEITEIWVKGAGAGTTDLVFSLVPIDPDPLAGLRPISDILVVNVNA